LFHPYFNIENETKIDILSYAVRLMMVERVVEIRCQVTGRSCSQ